MPECEKCGMPIQTRTCTYCAHSVGQPVSKRGLFDEPGRKKMLYKTTLIIWSEYDPSEQETGLEALARAETTKGR